MFDTSGSIGESDFIVAKSFIGDIVSSLNNVGSGQRVAMISYSTNTTFWWNLDGAQTSSLSNLQTAIDNIVQDPYFTNTAEALELCGTAVFGSAADNPAAPNIGILITDGRANYRNDEIGSLAAQLRSQGTTLICIGVTNQIDMDELKEICDDDMIFTENSYSELVAVLDDVSEEVCPTKNKKEHFCCCSPNIIWNLGLGRSN
jgi:Mg-chelatase subunit ChlD